jgi:superfamily I DNA/RNA helicase
VEEKADSLIVVKNQAETPVILKKDAIEFKTELKLSLMPEGLLNRMNREEILDLLAYLRAGGDPNHAAFRRRE